MGVGDFLRRSGVYKEDHAQVDIFLLMLETREYITLLLSHHVILPLSDISNNNTTPEE